MHIYVCETYESRIVLCFVEIMRAALQEFVDIKQHVESALAPILLLWNLWHSERYIIDAVFALWSVVLFVQARYKTELCFQEIIVSNASLIYEIVNEL